MKIELFSSSAIIFIIAIGSQLSTSNGEIILVTLGAISSIISIGQYLFPTHTQDYTNILQNIEQLVKINEVEISEQLVDLKNDIIRIINKATEKNSYDRIIFNVKETISDVEATYKKLYISRIRYLNHTLKLNKVDIILKKNMLTRIFSEDDDATEPQTRAIHRGLTDELGVLHYLSQYATDNDFSTCSKNYLQSYQQSLQKMLKLYAASFIKAYLNLNMAADLYFYIEKVKPSQLHSLVGKVNETYNKVLNAFEEKLESASRFVWRCDPDEHEEGKTYIRPNFFQKFVVNTYNLIELKKRCHFQPGCNFDNIEEKDRCVYTDEYRHYGIDQNLCTLRRKCAGKLYQCKTLEGSIKGATYDNAFVMCHAGINSTRRFESIKVYDKTAFYKKDVPITSIGEPQKCNERLSREHLTLPGYWYCHTCMCTCDDQYENEDRLWGQQQQYTYRFIYTGPLTVDTSKNYIVTGVRLAAKHGIIYPEIEQGVLHEEGFVDPNSRIWKTVPEYSLKNTSYYYKITWTDRKIALHDVEVPADHVMTGIQFDKGYKAEEPLRVVVCSKPFDILTGVINSKHFPTWTDSYKADMYRDTINVEGLKLPHPKLESNMIKTNQHLLFSTSDVESDVGQTTTPFWDLQDVTTTVPMPMAGVGLYYKHRQGSSGYISLRLRTYDVSQQLKLYKKKLLEFGEDEYMKNLTMIGNRIGLFPFIDTKNST